MYYNIDRLRSDIDTLNSVKEKIMSQKTVRSINDLLAGSLLPQLPDGEYKMVVKSFNVVTNENGGYIGVELQVDEKHNRVLVWNVFPSQLSYFLGSVAKAKGMTDGSADAKAIPYADILEGLAGTELLVHTEWNTDYNNRNYQILTGDDVSTEEATQNIEDVLAGAGL